MIGAVGPGHLARFRGLIERRLGLSLHDTKLNRLAETLEQRLEATGGDATSYLDRLESHAIGEDELRSLGQELTVGETYFFRHMDQFRAFTEAALPNRIAVRASIRQLRILSAGCASGEEAYSLAILLREKAVLPDWTISIMAVDLSSKLLRKAARARYSPWSLRETPADLQQRWFSVKGQEFALEPSIASSVTFAEHNLTQLDPEPWQPGSFDVVFCRNVLMYFTPDAARRVVRRFAKALAPNGYLFLGHAETLRGISEDFDLRHTHGAFYYQRKDDYPRKDEPSGTATFRVPDARDARGGDFGWTTTWIEAVQSASDRIRALTEKSTSPAPASSHPEPPDRQNLEAATALVKAERFGEALALLDGLPPPAARDPEVVLLRAVLLTHTGDFASAERACAELIARNESNAGAHYLTALCREGRGDRPAAIDHDQTAARLDPGFAMPRLHLGLMARRAGERETAQRELALAILLLEREDPSRLLLFGGGFGKDGLIALCRAELNRMGRTE